MPAFITRLLGWKPTILARSFTYLQPYRKLVTGVYAAVVAIFVLNLAVPQIIRLIVDLGIRGRDLRLIAAGLLVLLLITLVKGVLAYYQGRWSELASQSVAYDLRNEIQRKLTLLSFSFHDQAETGELLSRAVQDVERIRFLTGRAALRIVEAVLLLTGYMAVLLWMNAGLALLVIATLPPLVHRALVFGRRFRPLSVELQKQLAVLTTAVEQNLRGSQVVKAYAQESAEIHRFEQENERWFGLSAHASRLQAINTPFLFLIANFGLVFIIWYGGTLVVRGQLTLGELVAFTAYVGLVIEPVRRLGLVIPAVALAGASGERIFEILDSVSEVKDDPAAPPLPPVEGRVRFEQVSFRYGSRQVLQDIDFEAQPGQMIALLGQTGSGKSTLIHLIPRFYDVTAGRITVDGHDLRRVALHSLRSQVGIVLQETTLFAASIYENIAFGRAGASREEVIAAAQAAQAHDFILQMPEGYDTRVGERGVTLSGGQKQRIAIARVLVMDPRILLLDDATASVDSETEHLIQRAFERVMQGRTTFVIAHRLSTVRRADGIVVLERGRIAAMGRHAELLQASPLYAEIYRRQLAPASSSTAASSPTAAGSPAAAGSSAAASNGSEELKI